MKKALMVFLCILFSINIAEASQKGTVKGIRNSSKDNHARIVVDIDGPVSFTSNRLADPDRLYFDIKNCALSAGVNRSQLLSNSIIKSVRTSQFDGKTVRVVLDIMDLKSYSAFTLQDPTRLVIDIYSHKSSPSPTVKQETEEARFKGIRSVLIDPGHGGKDPGAIGSGGLREKDVVLDIALKLGRILEKNGLEVMYTRKKDIFVPLNERTEIANKRDADLFISIHTNSSRNKRTRGVETYFLNWTSDREAMRLAARENKISYSKMEKVQGDLQVILLDLARNHKHEESKELAFSVQNTMVGTLKKHYSKIKDHRVKWALFYVLVGAEMPSVLVEVSFISNREEEKRLSTDKYRSRIAEALASGVTDCIKKSTLIVKRSGKERQLP
jgi:N-acetylmuramoyl-L-alanine amidase